MLLSILLTLSPTAFAHGNGHHSHHNRPSTSHNRPHHRPAQVRTGQLLVHNASYQQVQVFVDGVSRGYMGNGSMSLSVVEGVHRVKVVHNGRVLNNRDVRVYGNSQSSVSVNIPTVAQMWVTNYEPYPVFVYIDGRQVTTLAAGESRCLDVALGGHRVDMVDARQYGGTVITVSVNLDGWTAGAVTTPQRQASTGHRRPR